MKVQVLIRPEAEGGFSAIVPGFPGCSSCGETIDETVANVTEAFEGVLEVMQQRGRGLEEEFSEGTDSIRRTIEV